MTDVVHATAQELEAALEHMLRSPKDGGRLELIVRRPAVDQREIVETAELDVGRGLVGDNWKARGSRGTPDGSANPEMQLTLMNSRVIASLARERERWALAGDQLYLDLDLGTANLPPGARLSLGSAIIEITAAPHTGCGKFARRFGVEAVKFVNASTRRGLKLRGVNARVVRGGTVRIGDVARKL